MPLWQPGGPNGFSDDSCRLGLARGDQDARSNSPRNSRARSRTRRGRSALVEDILGPGASAATREAVTRAESREQAYALLILSPEFQRR